jgi:uncharacterized membrane protein
MDRLKDLLSEIKLIFTGKTLDAIIPPLIFVIINGYLGLSIAIIVSLVIALVFFIYRVVSKQSFSYALFGLVGILLAGGFAFVANNATNFFLPDIITNGFILVLSIGSLIINKPIAAYLSHLTRGWTLNWFWRKDILPAYREVTYMWTAFFLIRTIIQVVLFIGNDVNALLWTSTIMGLPATFLILTISYVYGIWRLKQLGGPGIDEFDAKKQPPYRGQNRGF